jgi:hypothetical protein
VENAIEHSETANVLHLRRLKRPKPKSACMTIALGMRVHGGGIILAADRLLSTERHQFMDEKLTVYPLYSGAIFFAFADSPVTAKEVRQKIEARLDAVETFNLENSLEGRSESRISLAEIGQVSEAVINEVYANRLGSMPLQMLIAAAIPGEGTAMWLYDGEAGFNIAGQFLILGAGESSLIRYLETAYSRQDSVELGENVAIYLIHQAEQFIPGCKGIDVISISDAANWDWLDQDEIAAKLDAMKAREKEQIRKIVTG